MRPNDSPKPRGSTFSPDAFPDGLLVVDSRLDPVCCNAAFAEMWNVAQADVTTAPGYALIDRLAGAVVDSADFSARAKSLRERPAGRSHESLILNDGRVFEWFSEPLTTNPHAKEALAAWIFRDVTTGTGGLHHVIDDAEEFRAIVDQNVAGVYVLELDGTIAYINPTFARMAGYEQADLLGRSFGEFVADGDRREAMANFSRLIAGEIQAVPHTVACVGKNGRTITVLSQERLRATAEGPPSSGSPST